VPGDTVDENMPRDFDSDEQTKGPLSFVENVDCPACATVFEGFFFSESISFEDMAEPPMGAHTCPACGNTFRSEATGWSFYSEAG
jgi:uncharacterized Zn-finger protein